MKKLIMAMLIAVSMVQTLSAQDNNRQRMTPQQRTEQRIQKLDEKLSLTDNQKSQIRDLYADFYKQKYPKEKRKEAMEKLITDIYRRKQQSKDGNTQLKNSRHEK